VSWRFGVNPETLGDTAVFAVPYPVILSGGVSFASNLASEFATPEHFVEATLPRKLTLPGRLIPGAITLSL
jgi:hypothetical protein